MDSPSQCHASEDSSWRTDIQNNLSILTENIGNIECVLIKLLEANVISFNESAKIEKQSNSVLQNWKLLQILKTKGWNGIKSNFLQILRQTHNDYCANIIESYPVDHHLCSPQLSHINEFDMLTEDVVSNLLKSKWWPEKKMLPNSFYERKTEKELFTEKLKNLLAQNENKNKMTVINQKVAVSGLGGVGKSTTAKWFGHQYENDYEFIFWIDCGEGSLIKSFTNLARVLNVKDRKELELKELAWGCFEILEKRNCLLIYDNAECYVGVEGIRDVLPRNNDKFHIIITSRNRNWGNDTGYGLIPEFQLDVFEKREAIDFMNTNFNSLVKRDESQLEKICDLLGNLPLALQIAVAAVNRSQISLPRYIEILKHTGEILVTTFDDYEKTINKTMQISLDIIQHHEKDIGGLAYQILLIFGFITPDDVELAFFKSVKKERTAPEIYGAAKLLESYSLVTHKTITEKKLSATTETEDRFSIHRLLQQVIRHISAESKIEILKTILTCEGFLENKLIPYSYADKKLQDEFPEIKTELIDKLQLRKLLSERKFKEAMELSHLINDTIKNSISHYNYALCLKYNTEIELALENFKQLFQQVGEPRERASQIFVFNKFGILENTSKLPIELVGGQLLLLYYRPKLEEEAKHLFTTLPKIFFHHTDMNEISPTLNWTWNIKPKASYQFIYYGREDCWTINKEYEDPIKKIKISNCVLNENFQLKQLPKDLEELCLTKVTLLTGRDTCTAKKLYLFKTHFVKSFHLTTVVEMTITGSEVNIHVLPESLQKLNLDECVLVAHPLSRSSPTQPQLPQLQELTLRSIQTLGDSYKHLTLVNLSRLLSPKLMLFEASHYWNATLTFKFSNIPLTCLQLVKHLSLESCKLIHADGIRIAPQSLKFAHVQIVDTNELDLSHKLLNDFIDLRNLESIYLEGMSIDLCYPVNINTVDLRRTKIVNWNNSKCRINHLDLLDIDVVEQTEMTVMEMKIFGSLVDISRLPQSLVILHLSNVTLADSYLLSANHNSFPCLQKLVLFMVKVQNSLANTEKVIAALLRLSPGLNELIISCSDSTSVTIHLLDLLHIQNIYLQKCSLMYAPAIVLSPKEVILRNVNIIEQSTNNVVNIQVNEFLRFTETEILKLEEMSLDFAESVRVSSVSLLDTELTNWENGKWCIDNLRIWPDPGPTNMRIIQQEIKEEFYF